MSTILPEELQELGRRVHEKLKTDDADRYDLLDEYNSKVSAYLREIGPRATELEMQARDPEADKKTQRKIYNELIVLYREAFALTQQISKIKKEMREARDE